MYTDNSDFDDDNFDGEISSDDDEVYGSHGANKLVSIVHQTKFNHLHDVQCYTDNNGSIVSLVQSRKVKCEYSSGHFLCFGLKQGFFFRIGFHINDNDYENYKLIIPWHHIWFIGCYENDHQSVVICVKYCVEPIIQRLKLVPNTGKRKGKKKKKKKKKNTKNDDQEGFVKRWTTVSIDECAESVKEFIHKPKIEFVLKPSQYICSKIKDSIMCHSKIMSFQKAHKINKFKHKMSFNYDDEEKEYCMVIYRSSYSPYIAKHDQLKANITAYLGYMFDGTKGRQCVSCHRNIGYFEAHPICIERHHTVESCDSNIIKAIHRTKYDQNCLYRSKLSMCSLLLLLYICMCTSLLFFFFLFFFLFFLVFSFTYSH